MYRVGLLSIFLICLLTVNVMDHSMYDRLSDMLTFVYNKKLPFRPLVFGGKKQKSQDRLTKYFIFFIKASFRFLKLTNFSDKKTTLTNFEMF